MIANLRVTSIETARRAAAVLVLVLVLVLVATSGCDRAPSRPELREIPRPDIANAEPAVQEQIDTARARLDSLLADEEASHADLAAAFGNLGFVYLTYEFLEAAEVAVENAARVEPAARRWVYLQGLIVKTRGEAPRAKELLERALAMEPNDPATLVRLGDTELEIGNTSEARARFEQALALDPQSAAAMDGLGKVASATGDVERAIELWKQALALQPGAGSLHYTLALAYRRLGKIEDAEYHMARRGEAVVVLDDPVLEPFAKVGKTIHLLLAQGNRAMEDRRYDAAADAFQQVIERDPENFHARRGLATALYLLGDEEAAVGHLEEGLRRITADDDAARTRRLELLRALAGLQLRSGHDDVAAATLERMLEIDPDRLEARSELADALARQGQLDRAIAEYERILGVEPRNVPTLVKRATARINAGQVEPGLRDFEQAVAAAPGEPAIRLRYAEALDRLGRSGAAAAQRAAAGGGSQSGDATDRAHLLAEQGRRAVAVGRYDEAIIAFRQAIEAAPGDSAARLELARVLGHVGRFDEADAEFMRVIAASPRDENAWRGHVLSLLLAGKLDESKVALRDALRVFPRSSSLANALARLLATATADDVRDSALALDLAQRVHQVEGDSSSAETLAAAMAESGRFAEAVALQRPIVAAATDQAATAELARARLDSYERGQPWRLRTTEEIAVLITTSSD